MTNTGKGGTRLAIAAALIVAAVYFAHSGQDGLAIGLLAVGVILSGSGIAWSIALLVMYAVIAFLISIPWMIAFYFHSKLPVDQFLETYWYIPALALFQTFIIEWMMRRRASETWSILGEQYSSPWTTARKINFGETQWGTLLYEEETLDIRTYVERSGVVLMRTRKEPLHISWDRIRSIYAYANDVATIGLESDGPLPFVFEIPWRESFSKKVPGDILKST